MNIFELFGKVSLEGSDKIKGQLTDLEKNTEKLQKRLKMVGAAFTAVGAAGIKLTDDALKLNARLGVTAITIGSTTEEMRGMVLETANVTFGIDEVIKTFDLLARAGLRSEEQIKFVATAFDTLADAVGGVSSTITSQLIMAMKTFQMSADDIAGSTDKMTFLLMNTTLSMDNFAAVVGYITPDLVEMGLTLDDTIALLGIMEGKGVSGAVATREFRSAITEATTEQIPLNEALGVTTKELEDYKAKLQDTTGLTQEYADAANAQYGVMDNLRFMWSKITFQLGSVLTPLQPVFALMTAMGPVMIFLSTSVGASSLAWLSHAGSVMKSHINQVLHIGSTTALAATTTAAAGATVVATGAQHGLNAAMMANPIIAIIAGIAALVTAIVFMWKNWESVSMQMEAGWLRFKQLLGLGTPTTQAQLDALKLEATWIGVRNQVTEAYDTIISEVDRATQAAITGAQNVADVEIAALEARAQAYRDKHYEKMKFIDDEMMAEIQAANPALYAQLLGFEKEIEGLDNREAARKKTADAKAISDLEQQLKSDDLHYNERVAIEDKLEALEDAGEVERIMKDRNLAIDKSNMEGYFENQKTAAEKQLQETISGYDADLEALKELNIDKLTEIEDFMIKRNDLLDKYGITSSVDIATPSGPAPPSTRKNKPGPADLFNWFKGLTTMEHGGVIPEPTLLMRLRDMVPYGIAGEAGPEPVGAAAGGDTYNISFPGAMVREESDLTKIGEIVSREMKVLQDRNDRRGGV